jgi:hypothetical protein
MRRLIAPLLLLLASTAFAADVWVLQGGVGACDQLQWHADTILLNTGTTPAVVRLLDVSDGPDMIAMRELAVMPNHSVALGRATNWAPAGGASTFFLHLDVPDDVVVRNVLNVGTTPCSLVPTPDETALFGTTQLPAFRLLTPAGATRYVLNTDLGRIAARTNVGLYNAGNETAVADVQLVRACDNQVLDRLTFTIGPNASRQISLHASATTGCGALHQDVQDWVDYVVITVSQPSLAYVANIANTESPRVLVGVQ